MIIGITGRKQNKVAKQAALKAIRMLEGKGIKAEVDKAFLGKGKNLSQFGAGIVLSFGGDGTLLQVYRDLKKNVPVMGINCGSLGFLQSYKHTEIEQALEAAIAGNYSVEKRTRLCAKVDGKNAGTALNEALVVPAKAGRLIKYKLKIGKEERNEAGDGLIVATPTGSTAHSLSAGGPMVKGNAAVFVVVSINPVDWKHRPLIINDHEKITVSGFAGKAEIILDGQKRFAVKKKVELAKGTEVLLAVRKG